MSRAPDLSAFPIPRKGGAKPIVGDDVEEAAAREGAGEGSGPEPRPAPAQVSEHEVSTAQRAAGTTQTTPGAPNLVLAAAASRAPTPPPVTSGQTVATTVKLDENRYLRLMEAGRPGPGRLKRRTIQDMLIEALDEWFERRQL